MAAMTVSMFVLSNMNKVAGVKNGGINKPLIAHQFKLSW
jgi:hypothetical protein